MNKIAKNFSYNVIYQILIIILPLITAPYISRVIGAEGLGTYSYTHSVAQYFILFAMLGINNYGNRTIAKCKNNKEKLSQEFSSLYYLQLFMSFIIILIYVIYISIYNTNYNDIAYIQLIYIFSTCFDINWLFFGLEKFRITVIRNVCIKIFTVLLIFLLVKSRNDLWIYTLIMTIGSLLSQLALWIVVKKEVKFVKVKIEDIKKHIKPTLKLFIPVVAVSLYKIMDKVMLGNMSDIKNVGLYENAEKIITIPLGLITALGTVMLPRMSNLIANGEMEKIKKYIDNSMEFVSFLSIPIMFGIIAISMNFVPIFFGNEFIDTGRLIQLLVITIIFISWANVIRTQYLIPNEKDKTYIYSVCLGAIVNVIANTILIPKYNAMGAVIGTVLAEFSVMIYQTYKVRNELDIKQYCKYFINFFIKGFIMFVIIKMLEYIIKNNTLLLIIVQIILGCIIYFTLNYRYIITKLRVLIKR